MTNNANHQNIPQKKRNTAFKVARYATIFIAIFVILNIFILDYTYINYVYFLIIIAIAAHWLLETILGRLHWETLADQIGMDIYPRDRTYFTKPLIRGNLNGDEVVFDNVRRSKGDYTQITMGVPNPRSDIFSIKKTGLPEGNEIFTKNAEIDKIFAIHGSNPDMILTLLQSTRIRQGLIELVSQSKSMNISLKESQLTYYEIGRTLDVDYLVALYNFLTEISEFIRNQDS